MEQSLNDVVKRVSQLEHSINAKYLITQPPPVQQYSTPQPHYSSPLLTPYYPSQCQVPYLPKQVDTSDIATLSDDDDDPPPLPDPIISPNAYPILPYQPAQYLQPKQLVNVYHHDTSANGQVPQCFQIQGKTKKGQQCSLPSIEINKENLCPCDTVIKKKYASE